MLNLSTQVGANYTVTIGGLHALLVAVPGFFDVAFIRLAPLSAGQRQLPDHVLEDLLRGLVTLGYLP